MFLLPENDHGLRLAILVFPNVNGRLLFSVQPQSFDDTREYRKHCHCLATRQQNQFGQPKANIIHLLAGYAVSRNAFMADRLVCDETVAYKAAQTDGEHRRLIVTAGWILRIVLFGDSHDHPANWKAYEAENLP